ncbi:unnamed protein product [Rhizophagus irregularis]|uniref:Uncharacterized protein n=1 Tax=Rhizophagus irregularis TaxID=588596 RepID=A0A916E4K0_9GLOM|nr:hypothetical protein GLOIN_2v1765544 [Rhizophagus irregularis DAOM 181602=DAOM 197198]CAB4390904.1 unnamed protein product [Rhizophagus irregularis]CAB4467048.1 unnamed protein product [Rhizophagus irregularis]CAB5360136.1 unnamed protein product [Rhizophagus irregularis]CAB5391794.1 unnamed protein product [Rhizophagus irregularis]
MSTRNNSHSFDLNMINFLRAVSNLAAAMALIIFAVNLADIVKEVRYIHNANFNIYEIYNDISVPSSNNSNITNIIDRLPRILS